MFRHLTRGVKVVCDDFNTINGIVFFQMSGQIIRNGIAAENNDVFAVALMKVKGMQNFINIFFKG